MRIEEVLARRSDLSTFLVHLTRSTEAAAAKDNLKSIISEWALREGAPMGHAVQTLRTQGLSTDGQRCVCFTETPLEHVSLLMEPIDNRACQFAPYGVAITRKQGRRRGVNPVWYVDITPGRTWLSNSINALIDATIRAGPFDGSAVGNLTPFIEQMGTGNRADGTGPYRKEFWWEREWRHVGRFSLPPVAIILCPEAEHFEFSQFHASLPGISLSAPRFVDPSWSLEQIIGRLAGFSAEDVLPF